jgi:carbonic anhydrase/acetyltransferase-like protein (isoleucine patch superfamily)
MSDARFKSYHQMSPSLGERVFVADTARVIGDVVIGDDSSVWFGTVIRGDVHHIRIGRRVNIQDLSVLHVTTDRYATIIADDVTVGHRAVLHGCQIEQGALVGMGAIVMDDAVVGRQAMVGAGALVTPGTVIPPGMLALGAPAKVVRPLTEQEKEHLLKSAETYQALARDYLTEQRKGR